MHSAGSLFAFATNHNKRKVVIKQRKQWAGNEKNASEEAAKSAKSDTRTEIPAIGWKTERKSAFRPTISESTKTQLKKYSQDLGTQGQQSMLNTYDGLVDASGYAEGFRAYYEVGRNGEDISNVRTRLEGAMSQSQKQAAYEAGRMDAVSMQPENGVQWAGNANMDTDALRMYNEKIDYAEGDMNDGREVGNGGNRREPQEVSGEQAGENVRGSRKSEERISATGSARRDGGKSIHDQDSEGRRINQDHAALLKGTAIVDDQGRPLAVYHFTEEMDFEIFARGDVGFHFGTYKQANQRGKAKRAKVGRMIRAYLNIRNPVRVDSDIMGWNDNATALKLWSMGILTDEDLAEINKLWVPKGNMIRKHRYD